MAGARVAALNRRLVAVHEGGHVIAAQFFGLTSFGMIWPEGDYWNGCAIIPGVDDMPPDQRRVIGIAGAAATMLWLGIPADRFFTMKVGMSARDWQLIGIVRGRSNVAVLRESLAFTLDLLKRERPALNAVSREIISESRRHAPETVRLAKFALSGGPRPREPWPEPSIPSL